ncbi:MAG: hypothetical protein QW412_01430, partial [Candidatus Aenigmatarchaeota archaeon]
DGKKILEDISSKSPNIFMLSALPSTLDTSLKAVKKFMRKNPKTVSEILTPLIESTFYGLKRLKSLNFAYEDCKVGFNWSMKRIRSSMDYFENIIGVDMDKEWWRKYKELKNHL